MIMEIPQLICCRCSTKSEISRDHVVSWARAPRVGPRTALTVTAHHLVNGIGAGVGGRGGAAGFGRGSQPTLADPERLHAAQRATAEQRASFETFTAQHGLNARSLDVGLALGTPRGQ